MGITKRLEALNIALEKLPERKMLEPVMQVDNLIFTSGQVSASQGRLVSAGKIGRDVTVEDGQRAARQSVINCLSALNDYLGSLDDIKRIVKITGFIQCSEDFTEQRAIMDAASELLHSIFGEKGKHARTGVGVYKLPLNASVEIEMIVEV